VAIHIERRKFIAALGGTAFAWPLTAHAQQPALPVVGFFGASTASSPQGYWSAALVQRLHELGWTDGHNVAIEYRWAEGRDERMTEIAAELVRLKVDVIVAAGTPAAIAAKQATSVIPIVITASGDPIGTGLVAGLARPGGNVTGLSLQTSDTAGKRLELLREVVPNLRRLAIMANVGSVVSVLDMRAAQAAAHTLGLEATTIEIRQGKDIAPAFGGLKARADALYITGDPLMATNRVGICILAASVKLPTIFNLRDYVETGGLMSYGANNLDLFRHAAEIVDKILRGMKPGDIPLEQPTKFELVINLTTAKALGLEIPHNLLVIADEVIE